MRHWIIGNGPSLKETPLHLLKDEVTWGMNRINLLYDKTDWRPTYYFLNDYTPLNKKGYWKDSIQAHWDTPKILWEDFRDKIEGGIGEAPNTTWVKRCEKHHYYMADNHAKRSQSWHLPGVCTAFSGVFAMMQYAILDGATELYLLGCDVNYSRDNTANHFSPDYTQDTGDRKGLDNTNMQWGHRVARNSSPVPIINCTIGGGLEVHPRSDVREVLNGKKG